VNAYHVCRHTADFRLNRLRPAHAQTNKKIPLDEGSADLLTAIMCDTPDIYGWHRAAIPVSDRRRRALGPRATMASFLGGGRDPHADGTIWASACWSARQRVAAGGHNRTRFDRMLLRGLEESRAPDSETRSPDLDPTQRTARALQRRRDMARVLEAMLRVDPALAEPVLAAMAAHGIHPGVSNDELADTARTRRRTEMIKNSAERRRPKSSG
jgi:hypothetical protein